MRTFGSTFFRFDELPSTNDRARELALSGAAEGTIVVAGRQTAGRGRQGKSWSSPAGQGLYLSIILRPAIKAADAAVITLGAAVAVREVLAEEYGIECDIKWPNDLTVADKKICGILMESASEGELLRYAVLGIGVNLLQLSFPEEIAAIATSVLIESGAVINPDEMLGPLLVRLEDWYRAAIEIPDRVLKRWMEISSYSDGASVRLVAGACVFDGITRGLTSTGALLIETVDGQRRSVTAGEVSLRRMGESARE